MADPVDHTLASGKGANFDTLLLLIIARAVVDNMAGSTAKTKLTALVSAIYDRMQLGV